MGRQKKKKKTDSAFTVFMYVYRWTSLYQLFWVLMSYYFFFSLRPFPYHWMYVSLIIRWISSIVWPNSLRAVRLKCFENAYDVFGALKCFWKTNTSLKYTELYHVKPVAIVNRHVWHCCSPHRKGHLVANLFRALSCFTRMSAIFS